MGRIFVGRVRETARLRALLRDEPVTLVLGRGGIGKTSLVKHALARRRAIWVGARPGDDERAIWLALARAIATSELLVPADDSTAALRAAVMDALESHRAVTVVDDVHFLEPADARSLARACRRSRRARWVLVGRMRAPDRLASSSVVLEDLDARALGRLARAAAPRRSASDRRRFVALADGSPLLLLRALANGGTSDAAEVVDALSKRAEPLLELLSALNLCIAPETARTLAGRPVPRHPDIVKTPEGLRLHDARRDARAPARPNRSLAKRLGDSAGSTEDAPAALEAIRFALEADDVPAAVATLDRHLDGIVEAGLGERLAPLLLGRSEAELAEPRLRLAVRLGGQVLAEVLEDPRPTTQAARVRYAEALIRASRLAEAKAILDAEPRSLEVDYLLGRTLYFMGDIDAAWALLESRRDDPRARAQLARIHATRGSYGEAIRVADELSSVEPDLSPFARRQVEIARTDVYASAGRLAQVMALLRRQLRGKLSGAQPWGNQVSLALLAQLEAEHGDLPAAKRIVAALRPAAARSATVRCECRATEARILAVEGDLAGALALAEECAADAERRGHRVQAGWLGVLGAVIAWIAGKPLPLSVPTVHDAQSRFVAALRLMQAVREGSSGEPLGAPKAEPIDAHVFESFARATVAFVEGDLAGAERLLRGATAAAEEHGYVVYAHEAKRLLFDVLFVAGKDRAASAVADELHRWGAAVGSTRFQLEAELARALLAPEPPIAVLERIAGAPNAAPSAARRARALLGEGRAVDRVDAKVLAACRWAGKVRSLGAADRASWGLHLGAGHVWLPDGRKLKTPSHALHAKILRAIVEAGGELEKEALVARVWGIADYHPLRDDKRLYVAIMRLRRMLGSARVRNVLGGYALGGQDPVRMVSA